MSKKKIAAPTVSLEMLLTKGYLPRELPPPFTSSAYGQLAGNAQALFPKDFDPIKKVSMLPLLSTHSLVRAAGLRRELGIPNPVFQYRLSKFIADNWTPLSKDATKSPFSRTVPTLDRGGRAIGISHSFDDWPTERARLRASARYIVQADISYFYPSVYTHAIPWAIHGKATSKSNRKPSQAMYGNQFDQHLRNLQDGQTGGIPIGPDTSLLAAEILLGAVDEKLRQVMPGLNGFRFIDDYEFGCATRGEAETALVTLEAALADFELSLNPFKTTIVELPEALEDQWVSELRTFPFRKFPKPNAKAQYHDLIAYFDLAFRHTRKYPHMGILKYAIPRLRSLEIEKDNWAFVQNLLSQCSLTEPATIPKVIDQLVIYSQKGWDIDRVLWESTFSGVISERLPLRQTSECAWALWGLNSFNLSLTHSACLEIENSEDMIVGLLGLHAREKGNTGSNSLAGLQRLMEPSELYGKSWLLCYEANRRGWMKSKSGSSANAGDSNFGFLETCDVSFYDENAKPKRPRMASVWAEVNMMKTNF